MALKKHKAATQVTLASLDDDNPLREWASRYWKLGALLTVVVLAGILGWQYVAQKAVERDAESWDRFRADAAISAGIFGAASPPSSPVLAELADEIMGTPAGPWARAFQVHSLVEDAEYGQAADALQLLEQEYPDHPLVVEVYRFAEGETPRRLADHLRERMEDVMQWERDHESLFKNPVLPPDSPKVRLNTSKGSILLGLYEATAPKHTENFLKHCDEVFYDGTLFHRIGRSFMIQGGDPNSRTADKSAWGQGGSGYTIVAEISDLKHFPYVLAAAKKPNEVESSGSQFYITTGSPHHLDGVHTVFGVVLDGSIVVDEIAAGEIEAGTIDRPRDPVVLSSTQRVE